MTGLKYWCYNKESGYSLNKQERVISFGVDGGYESNKFWIEEGCDHHFDAEYSKLEAIEVIEMSDLGTVMEININSDLESWVLSDLFCLNCGSKGLWTNDSTHLNIQDCMCTKCDHFSSVSIPDTSSDCDDYARLKAVSDDNTNICRNTKRQLEYIVEGSTFYVQIYQDFPSLVDVMRIDGEYKADGLSPVTIELSRVNESEINSLAVYYINQIKELTK